jgi:hypothetical protein
VGEGIFAAAIAARFTHKNQEIREKDVFEILDKMGSVLLPGPGAVTKDTRYKSLNANPKVVDEVVFHLSLAGVDMVALLDKTLRGSFADIYKSSVAYANSPTVTAWSKLLYENNQENHILVSSAGTEDQTGTKVDVRVEVDKTPTNINVSLKVGDVKQFGQVSGSGLDKMQNLFGPLGVNLMGLDAKYTSLIAHKKVERALWLAYETTRDQINKQMSGPASRKEWLKKLGEFITFHATRNEENVSLVQLNRNDAHIYVFDNIDDHLKDQFIKAQIADSAGKPKLVLSAGGGTLLEIRCKHDLKADGTPYVRNYIEKGKLLTELVAQHVSAKH